MPIAAPAVHPRVSGRPLALVSQAVAPGAGVQGDVGVNFDNDGEVDQGNRHPATASEAIGRDILGPGMGVVGVLEGLGQRSALGRGQQGVRPTMTSRWSR